MKITKLADKILKKSVKKYRKTGNRVIQFEEICNWFSEPKHIIQDAIYMLARKNLFNVQSADNIPYLISLNINGIKYNEENSFFKKLLRALKEIFPLINR